jgi:hypothetical protein
VDVGRVRPRLHGTAAEFAAVVDGDRGRRGSHVQQPTEGGRDLHAGQRSTGDEGELVAIQAID